MRTAPAFFGMMGEKRMGQLALSHRLHSVAELIPQGAQFADIGTDHAYLPVWLLQNGVITHAIAADLRQGPLERARETARRYGLTDSFDFRLCDGLQGINPDEANTFAICGMGGETMISILSAAEWTAQAGKRLILQPMSSFPELRSWLSTHGYFILRENVSCEGKTLYSSMIVEAGKMEPLTLTEQWAGRQSCCTGDPLRMCYLQDLLRRTERAHAGLLRAAGEGDAAHKKMLEQLCAGLREMLKECEA